MAAERLQKILARGGIASRRAAETLIEEGRVRVNGRIVRELGTRADPHHDRVEVDGKRVVAEGMIYCVLHKPRGVVSTLSDPEGRPTVADYLAPLGARVYPVGRLDFATSGILLATNDGDFANGLLHPKKKVPKTYVLKVAGQMSVDDLERWRRGVDLDDGRTLPAEVSLIRHEAGKTWLQVTLFEGRNQQIRRMGEATGFPVMRLARVAFAGVSNEGLAPGRVRALTRDELIALKKEYGVPRRVPAVPAEIEAPRRGRPARAARPSGRSASSGGGGGSTTSPTSGARYGGGSPGRRAADVREDWGGGSGRGRSGPSEEPQDDAPPGRGARGRTTGTGGGVKAPPGDYRMSRGEPRRRR